MDVSGPFAGKRHTDRTVTHHTRINAFVHNLVYATGSPALSPANVLVAAVVAMPAEVTGTDMLAAAEMMAG